MNVLLRIVAFLVFAAGVSSANAATYHLEESLTGQWEIVSPDHYSYTYGPGTLISGDSVLLTQSAVATAITSPGTFNCITCTFTTTVVGGDKVFGTFNVDSFSFVANPGNPFQTDLQFTDSFLVTGGTGAFVGASGGGTISGTHFGVAINFLPQTLGDSIETVNYSDGIRTVPVPEPETYAMLLASLGVLGLVKRRKQSA